MKNVLITGGCGFIGSNFVNYIVPRYPHINFYNIDCLNYCSNIDFINMDVKNARNYMFFNNKLQDRDFLTHILSSYKIDYIVHFAAQSHVDASFVNAMLFTEDNIIATHILLECCRIAQCNNLIKLEKFIYISTDEVYGDSSLGIPECKTENSCLNPTNPYAASKAAAEMLCKSYYYSFGIPVIITRSNNVYGPNQYHDKLIPKFINLLKHNKPCTIHGDGSYMRSFIHVNDICYALELLLYKGVVNQIYNISSNDEYSVNDIANVLISILKPGCDIDSWKIFVKDRVFNDTRYLISSSKLNFLGWSQSIPFKEGLVNTINWYINNS